MELDVKLDLDSQAGPTYLDKEGKDRPYKRKLAEEEFEDKTPKYKDKRESDEMALDTSGDPVTPKEGDEELWSAEMWEDHPGEEQGGTNHAMDKDVPDESSRGHKHW